MLSILCTANKRELLTDLIYTETTTLGVRVNQIERESLDRETVSIGTKFGPVDVKIGRIGGRIVNAMPEYEQIRKIALENEIAFQKVRDIVIAGLNTLSQSARL